MNSMCDESFGRALLTRGFAILCVALIVAAPAGALAAPTVTVLHFFTGNGDAAPEGGLIADSNGNFFGTTSGTTSGGAPLGVVFELSPPGGRRREWTETVLHAFTGAGDGGYPGAALIADSKGNLFGTTFAGGASGVGTVFELSPPATAGGAWTETVLYAFTGGSDGGQPRAGLIADSNGNLFGTTYAGGASGVGTVFALSPPAIAGGAWTETVLSSFNYGDGAFPFAGLIADSNGNLYGTTSYGGVSCPDVGCGTVFELMDIGSPPTPPRICAICRSPPICCACAGGVWTGKECL
jgi:uncharacterized repeat protein (TIGR03803 family)